MNGTLVKWLTMIAVAMALALPASAADDETEEFEKRVKRLNGMAEKPAIEKVALQRIATETGVPLERVQNQHKKFPEIGVAGLMVANVIGADTRKNAGGFLAQRQSGKRWLTIAKENKVPPDRINDRLQRLEKAIKGDK